MACKSLVCKALWTEKLYWHTETTVRCNEVATFTYILRMHTCITFYGKPGNKFKM